MRRPTAQAAMSRPGADTRLWATFGVVLERGYDPVPVTGVSGGVFVDVQFQPSGEIETCYVGMPYAGDGFGSWWPLDVGDTVLVVVPSGDSGYGPVIVSRFWNSGDLPPPGTDLDWAPGAGALEPPTDVVVRMKPGVAYKLRAQGGDIDIRVEGTGDVVIENLGTGKVKLGVAATAQAIALAPLVSSMLTALQAAVTAAPIVAADGGASLKTALAAALGIAASTPIGTLKTEAT